MDLTPPSDCYRWEAFGASLAAGGSTATQMVGFDVDPAVSTFTVYVALAADIRERAIPAGKGGIAGNVTSGTRGALENVTVTASPGGAATTNATGFYSLSGLDPGSTSVSLSNLPAGCAAPAAVSATVTAGGVANVSFAVTCTPLTGSIQGTVSKADATPLSGVTVSASPAAIATTTAADGGYLLANVPTGSQQVSLSNLPGGCSAPAQSVTVAGGATATANFEVTCVTVDAIFVSPLGDDNSAGTSSASPVKTIARGLARAVEHAVKEVRVGRRDLPGAGNPQVRRVAAGWIQPLGLEPGPGLERQHRYGRERRRSRDHRFVGLRPHHQRLHRPGLERDGHRSGLQFVRHPALGQPEHRYSEQHHLGGQRRLGAECGERGDGGARLWGRQRRPSDVRTGWWRQRREQHVQCRREEPAVAEGREGAANLASLVYRAPAPARELALAASVAVEVPARPTAEMVSPDSWPGPELMVFLAWAARVSVRSPVPRTSQLLLLRAPMAWPAEAEAEAEVGGGWESNAIF